RYSACALWSGNSPAVVESNPPLFSKMIIGAFTISPMNAGGGKSRLKPCSHSRSNNGTSSGWIASSKRDQYSASSLVIFKPPRRSIRLHLDGRESARRDNRPRHGGIFLWSTGLRLLHLPKQLPGAARA